MFHVEDDFDFDDCPKCFHFYVKEVLDTSSTVSDISRKLEDVHKNLQKSEVPFGSLPNIESKSFKDVRQNDTSRHKEILNLWEKKDEKYLLKDDSELIMKHAKKTVRPRKFPGPAGLLPERLGNTSLIATEEFLAELNSENDDSNSFQEKDVLSQSSGQVFESGSWSALMEDLGVSGRKLISLMNLTSLRLKHTKGYKVPFLAVIINSIDCTLPDPTVVVKDLTDEMHGMLHRDVWEKFNSEMIPGSVLVLKNVGVINAGTSSRRHILNITANNLSAIYFSSQDEHVQIRKISELPTGDNSKMLTEWEKIVSPVRSDKFSRNHPLASLKSSTSTDNAELSFFTSAKSKPILFEHSLKTSINQRPLLKNIHSFANSSSPSSSSSYQPPKKRKNTSVSEVKPINESKKQTTLLTMQNNTFKIDSDISLVDSLLDGVDTDSLFEEF